MSRHAWTNRQVELLCKLYPSMRTADVAHQMGLTVRQCYSMAQRQGLKKDAAFLASAESGRLRADGHTERMIAGRFQRGMKPWNKGTSYQAGGRSAETRFKPGQKSHTALPVGSYRIDGQGLLQRKVGEASGSPSRRWRSVHELVWIEAHGPVPEGHIVVFRPGMRTAVLEEITLARIECISRAELARRNHPKNRSPEYARLVSIKGAITRHVNRITREAAQKEAA